ncbi:phosphoribosyl-ATP diphosphatase [Ignisphaera sp. 4213-co]|uniref:Phosphoribosyl-ATP pyrophosphatase n=1 Tax=Ignisphaera cupida TaxID=3050454 RepID=A0ABD4Z8E0_9CREN|nr:phosphoribosyl-ATP diphosphatase [Ignisphaera sp. 4213-co]MDK6028373.1 phosphoribosyl-ATP diphosphatase [Ignisphaera sp. 4213-co]
MCETIEKLYKIILDRLEKKPVGSYTAQLASKGRGYVARKLGEEAVEAIVASLSEDRKRIVEELADLIYHMLVFMAINNVSIDDVCTELEARMKK